MAFISNLKCVFRLVRGFNHNNKIKKGDISKLNYDCAELLRNTHSIEKGLSIENPRLGFGHIKQQTMLDEISILKSSQSKIHKDACLMALDALSEYVDYHDEHNYSDDFIEKLKLFLSENHIEHDNKMGGTTTIHLTDFSFDTHMIEKFFLSRHSIRDFNSEPIDEELLKKALILAQQAPSACNRQAVRAYVTDEKQTQTVAKHLSGIGGFEKSVGRFVFITGKISAYREDEIYQYIVSASMYAAYLSLTLNLYKLGGCVVQRPVIWHKQNAFFQDLLHIDEDEQIICLMAVGNFKDSCNVPMSYRIKNDEMIQFLESGD